MTSMKHVQLISKISLIHRYNLQAKTKVSLYDIFYVFNCLICGLKFVEEKRLKIHFKTHEKKDAKNKTPKRTHMPDFEKPDFSQVM